jgi:hypothetical protein
VLLPGIYASTPVLSGDHCWFLSSGVYDFQAGLNNSGDVISNELKPPGEPSVSNNALPAANQFWNADGANCQGGYQLVKQSGPRDISLGTWSFVLTSVRSDTYNGVSYQRESAPSTCEQINLTNHFDDIVIEVSNVAGATSYNIYAAPPGNGCAGPFGLATSLPVTGPVQNTNTNPCPVFTGGGCSLGNESIFLSSQLASPFAPNATAPPGTGGAYPPDGETGPLAAGLPNENPQIGPGPRGDRANENNCETVGGAYTGCPAAITPGAVELYFPAGGCFTNGAFADAYVFSGYQYNWVSVYEPGPGWPPANGCTNSIGAGGNSAYIGLFYAPSARVEINSQFTFEAPGTGGIMASTFGFSGPLPSITFSASYAPVPPASRLTS